MCMSKNEFMCLAYASLMGLALAGTYVLGDDSWMAYLLFVPAFLLLKAMDAPQENSSDRVHQRHDGRQPVR